MSLSQQGGRRSWRVLSQLRQSSSSSSLPRPPSAHLGLQKFRLHGSFSICSSSYLHHFYSSPSFSSAAEAAHMANSADPEAIPSVGSVSENHEATSSSAMESNVHGEQEETILKKMLEEHRELVSSLRADLEDQKALTRSILDQIRVLKMNVDAKTAESKVADQKQHCLEWIAFMEHLQSSDFFKGENREPSSDSGTSILEDPICVKRAIYKFSRAHESVFESLSPIDLRIIARHGSSANYPKASASQKRLCQFFHIEDISSDAGAAKPAFTQPKLSDVTRLLYSSVLERTCGDDVKSSISHLLREIVTLSKKPSVTPLPTAETTLSSKLNAALSTAAVDTTEGSKQEKEKDLKKEKAEEIQKVGTAKREEAMKVAARSEARSETSVQVQEWKCPRCSFMNLDTKHRCVECSRRRPQRTYGPETVKSTNGISVVEEDLDVKVLVEEKHDKKAHERKATLPSPSTQGRKDRSSSLVNQDQDTTDVEDSSDETNVGSEGSDAFSVLDDILDSEDVDDEQQEEAKITGLSDDSEEEQQGNGIRTPLSNLFPKMESKSSSRRDDQRGLEQRNGKRVGNRPSKSKRFEDDDDNRRSRHGSVGEDSEDDDPPPQRYGRGFGSQGDDYSRRPGRGGYRGRGGPRGYGGGRGDSFDGRRSDGGPRGSSVYGDRDGGGRSSSYGSRPQRGKPRF